MSVTVATKGFRELEQQLAELASESVRRRVGVKSLKVGGTPMMNTAKRLAPKDEHDLEGAIAMNNGRRRRGSDPDIVEVLIGLDPTVKPTHYEPRERTGKRQGPVPVLGPFQYGPMQEEGTVDMPANPFMRPAFDQEGSATIDRVGKALGGEIEAAAARQAKRAAKAG